MSMFYMYFPKIVSIEILDKKRHNFYYKSGKTELKFAFFESFMLFFSVKKTISAQTLCTADRCFKLYEKLCLLDWIISIETIGIHIFINKFYIDTKRKYARYLVYHQADTRYLANRQIKKTSYVRIHASMCVRRSLFYFSH